MKHFFAKENFLSSGFEPQAKRQSIFVTVILAFLFLVSAITFLKALYAFTDAIGSIVSGSPDVMIKDLLRSIPLILSCFMSVWALLLFHGFYRNASDEKRTRSLYKNSIALVCFAGIAILYVLIGRIAGEYSSLVEGSPSPWYPLDSMLFACLFLALGIFGIVYGKKLSDKLPYVVPSRGPIVTKARFGYCFGVAIWMLVALFSFSAFWLGLFIIDFAHGYVAYSIGLLLVFLTNFCFIGVWEFYYNNLTEEARKKILLPLGITALCIAVAVDAFYFIALSLNLDGPANVGFGVLPVAFAAGVNIATLIVAFTPLVVGIIALIKGVLIRKK